MNVLVCPDKFKGTLKAHAAAQAIASGWRSHRPGDTLKLLPISDGGDGFGELLAEPLRARATRVRTTNAAGRPCWSTFWIADDQLAIIESARTIGLAMLPRGKYHPFELDTSGLARVLRAASDAGLKKCVLGIGGSATNDGGFGVARECGWEFLDGRGKSIESWTELSRLRSLRPPLARTWPLNMIVAVDVRNPLLGMTGASRVYGPQKGLRPENFKVAERCLQRLATVVEAELGEKFASIPGAGAAGGLGFGLSAFFAARIQGGFELFSRYTGLHQQLGCADLVITGEGSIDASTLMGKGVGLLAEKCRKLGKPCFGIGGVVALESKRRESAFTRTASLVEMAQDATEAGRRPAVWLRRAAADLAHRFEAQA